MRRSAKDLEAVAAGKGKKPAGDYLNLRQFEEATGATLSWLRKELVKYESLADQRLGLDYRMQPHYPPTLADVLRIAWESVDPGRTYTTFPALKRMVGGEGAWLRKQLQEIGELPVDKYANGKLMPHYSDKVVVEVVKRYHDVPIGGLDFLSIEQIATFFKIGDDCYGWLVDALHAHKAELAVERRTRRRGGFTDHYPFGILETIHGHITALPEAGDRLSLGMICSHFPDQGWWDMKNFLGRRPTEFPTTVCQYGEGQIDLFYPADAVSLLRRQLHTPPMDGWYEPHEIANLLQSTQVWVEAALRPYKDQEESGHLHLRGRPANTPRIGHERHYPPHVVAALREAWEAIPKAGRWFSMEEVEILCDARRDQCPQLYEREDGGEIRAGEKVALHYPPEVVLRARRNYLLYAA